VAPVEGQRKALRCVAPADDPDLGRLCDALVHAPNLADGIAVRLEPSSPLPGARTGAAAGPASDLLGLARDGDDLLLSLRRPQTRRTLQTRLPALLTEPPRAQAEAFRLSLAYLLEAPAEAGQPWPEGADERTPTTPVRPARRKLPPVGGLPAPPTERLRDLFGPTPHPLRPPLVLPGPAPAPRPGHAAVELRIDAPDEDQRWSQRPERSYDARNGARVWVGIAGLAGAEFEAGFTAGLAHPLHGPWHGRLSSTMAPFGEAGGGPLTAFATLLALEYLLPVRAIRARIHSGIEHRATLPQWADAQVDGRHRIAGAVGATLETSIGGPLALALDFDASLATGPTRARGINGDRVEGPLTGRTALLVVWTL
jgi:hypothetical protein